MMKMSVKVRKLLALAASGDTPEARTAELMARTIMVRYGLTEASILSEEPAGATQHIYTPGNGALWRACLANEIAKWTHCKLVRMGTGVHSRWSVIGTSTDFATWSAFYTRAEVEIDAEGARFARGRGRSDGDTFRKYAAFGFGERLRRWASGLDAGDAGTAGDAETARDAGTAGATPQSTAAGGLILVSRTLAVEAVVERLHPKTKSSAVTTHGSSSARSSGRAYGESLGVHRGSLK